jgi:hypothetical protein
LTAKPKAPTFAMQKVKSSQIEEIGHTGDCLCVTFKGGGTYHYHGVSADLFEQMKKSDSCGKFLHAHVKGKFKFVKV